MCGIFAVLNNKSLDDAVIKEQFLKGQNRGPEHSVLDKKYMYMILGFHRLAINGLNDISNQPIVINDVILICNGEIYNYKQLYEAMSVEPTTQSDCEVIIHLYLKYGIEQTLTMLDGVFAFILYDNRISNDLNNKIYVARDPYGVRPLYHLTPKETNKYSIYGLASELKCLEYFYNMDNNKQLYSIGQVQPGTYSVYNLTSKVNAQWSLETAEICYFKPSFPHTWSSRIIQLHCEKEFMISNYLEMAVEKRCLTTERPIACLLSGGLDSSLVTALVNEYYKKNGLNVRLETYSIGLEHSEDLKYARIVADYLETNHTEIIVTEDQMFDAIPEVIKAIESYDTTTVRASLGNYLIGKYIAANSCAKVIFNGDGSDELFGGYLYMNKCPNDIEFDCETRRLLKDIHLFDVLRSDKSISSHGLEPRTPFLDKSFANYVMSIPAKIRNHKNSDNMEKYLLRQSFSYYNYKNTDVHQLLPDEILWRKKEAFSDGVSSKERSLFSIIQEKISNALNKEQNTLKFAANITTEKYYYKKIFDEYYPNCSHVVPYYWMPKYAKTEDPSARTLDFYV
jgi:asparagine synthase (glutamine-hydrolysing)